MGQRLNRPQMLTTARPPKTPTHDIIKNSPSIHRSRRAINCSASTSSLRFAGTCFWLRARAIAFSQAQGFTADSLFDAHNSTATVLPSGVLSFVVPPFSVVHARVE